MAAAPREMLHRVAMLFSSDLPLRDLIEKFASMLAASNGATFISVTLTRDARSYFQYGEPRTGDAVIVPIAAEGIEYGSLSVEWPPNCEADDYDVAILETCAVQLGARIQRDAERAERDRLKEIASTDALTHLANRRTFDETLAREWQRCARSQTPLSVLLLDVDFFKAFNDTYGHVAGDGCLQRIARAIASSVKRPGDIACRYGGEEFAVILPETDAGDAERVAEAICAAVREAQIPHQYSSLGYATVSIGCAGTVPRSENDPSTLTQAADEQLYRAKENGRNRVAWAEAISEAPIVERQTAPHHNLPSAQNLFFGREGDLDVMAALLRNCRLLTLVGPGGVGKTRLSVEFARRHASNYPDGIAFVDLSSLTEGMFVAPAILASLNIAEEAGREAEETFLTQLHEKRMLLVLDNCEHLLDRIALLVEQALLRSTGPTFLATSRQPLKIEGEQAYRVATLQQGDAVALFSSRAHAAMPSFAISAKNLEVIKGICTQLGGIPLAIELAAARMRTSDVDSLESELRERTHHRTLDDTISWSYNTLGDDEKAAMARLSIFAGHFTLDAARAMTIDGDESFDLIDVLGRLIDNSLVQSDPVEGTYWLLEAPREFGRTLLEQNGEIGRVRRRYAAGLSAIASDAEKRFGRGAGDSARLDIQQNYADFRAAMEWAFGPGGDRHVGAALVAALGWYWTERGLWRESRYWFNLAFTSRAGEIGLDMTARLRLGSAVAYYVQADFAAMAEEAQRAEAAYDAIGDRTGRASAQNLMAIEAQHAGRLQDAHDLWQSVLQASKDESNVRMEGVVLGNLAELLTDWKANFEESERLYERAAQIHRQLTNSFPLGVTLGDWSATAAYQDDLRRAERLAAEALEIFRGIDEEMRVVEQLIRIGHYRVWAGRFDEARRTLREVVALLPGCANSLYWVRAAEAFADLSTALNRERDAAAFLAFADERRGREGISRPTPLERRLESTRLRTTQLTARVDTLTDDATLELARSLVG